MKSAQILAPLVAVMSLAAAMPAVAVYVIDPDHSSVTIEVTHLGIGSVAGRFDRFSGSFAYDPADLAQSTVAVKIDAGSINTNQAFRDKDLRSPSFLDVDRFPEITFTSTKVTRVGSDKLEIVGDLSLHGVSRTVTLDATMRGTSEDMDGKNRIGFGATAQINRRDYNLLWSEVVGANELVGKVITIFLNVEGVQQADSPK